MLMCSSPQLIAAYHVLLRLCEPRHPPYALNYFSRFFLLSCILSQYVNELYLYRYVENIGVEPLTSCVLGRRSRQLS